MKAILLVLGLVLSLRGGFASGAESPAPTIKASTAQTNVSLLPELLQIPGLNRQRQIRVYVPPGYANSQRRYPVLCMHDGQNLFDARLIAFITEGAQIKKILEHIGVDSQPSRIAPARGPPLWEDCDAQMDDVQIKPDWGSDWDLAQATPDFDIDQRVNW